MLSYQHLAFSSLFLQAPSILTVTTAYSTITVLTKTDQCTHMEVKGKRETKAIQLFV